MTRSAAPGGAVPFEGADFFIGAAPPASIIRNLTSMGEESDGSGILMMLICLLIGVTAIAFIMKTPVLLLTD
ncbi:MAG: hypothetical protein ACREO5_06765 [Candidatus Binatia bacterium]